MLRLFGPRQWPARPGKQRRYHDDNDNNGYSCYNKILKNVF